MVANSSLITPSEAEEVVQEKRSPFTSLRTPLLIILGVTIITAVVLLVMIIISLKGTRTGVEAIFPFLDNKPVQSLQEPRN